MTFKTEKKKKRNEKKKEQIAACKAHELEQAAVRCIAFTKEKAERKGKPTRVVAVVAVLEFTRPSEAVWGLQEL